MHDFTIIRREGEPERKIPFHVDTVNISGDLFKVLIPDGVRKVCAQRLTTQYLEIPESVQLLHLELSNINEVYCKGTPTFISTFAARLPSLNYMNNKSLTRLNHDQFVLGNRLTSREELLKDGEEYNLSIVDMLDELYSELIKIRKS